MGSMAVSRAWKSGVHSAETMGVDDGERMAGRGAHLHGKFLIMPGWGAALGGEMAQFVQGGTWNVLGGVRARGTGWKSHEGLGKPSVWISIA